MIDSAARGISHLGGTDFRDGAGRAQRAQHAIADDGAGLRRIGRQVAGGAEPAIALDARVDVTAPRERHEAPESPGPAAELLSTVVPDRDPDRVRGTR